MECLPLALAQMKQSSHNYSIAIPLFNLFFFTVILANTWASPTTNSNSYAQIYPRISQLKHQDPVFLQYSDDVALARKEIAKNTSTSNLTLQLYVYKATTTDTLLSIAARCSIPYDSLATLNRIDSIEESIAQRDLLLPNIPALYLPENAKNTIEFLLQASSLMQEDQTIIFKINRQNNLKETFYCFPNTVFDPTTRAFFLSPQFIFPLPKGSLSSSFGMRRNPVTGNFVFHKGIDLAAPEGTSVYACATGTVIDLGFDSIYGNYIIIKHTNNKTSLYGHLLSIKIELLQKVKSGTILGTVGSTGQSTGPHLHFEIHENGEAKNPLEFFKIPYKKEK